MAAVANAGNLIAPAISAYGIGAPISAVSYSTHTIHPAPIALATPLAVRTHIAAPLAVSHSVAAPLAISHSIAAPLVAHAPLAYGYGLYGSRIIGSPLLGHGLLGSRLLIK